MANEDITKVASPLKRLDDLAKILADAHSVYNQLEDSDSYRFAEEQLRLQVRSVAKRPLQYSKNTMAISLCW